MLKVKVKAPATVANVGSGFDVFGFAVKLFNEVELSFVEDSRKVEIHYEGERKEEVPLNKTNIVYRAVLKVLKCAKAVPSGMVIKIKNRIPLSRGLGSSASAVVSGVVAANELLGRPFTKEELLDIAVSLEGHPDNVTPSLFGGFTVSFGDKVRRIRMPDWLGFLAVVPDNLTISTSSARKILPEKVSMEDAVNNIAASSMLVYGLLNGDREAMKIGLKDRLHQPYRRKLLGSFAVLLDGVVDEIQGGIGAFISGSGSTVGVFYDETVVEPDEFAFYLRGVLRDRGVEERYKIMLLPPSEEGAEVEFDTEFF